MLRILLISRCPPYPLYLGDRLIIYHLAEELSKHNYTIDLLAFSDRESDRDEIDHYAQHFGTVRLIDEPERTQPEYLRRIVQPATRFPQSADEAWSPEMWQAIEARLAAENYDVVHFFGGIQVYEYRHAVRDVPTIITPYESYSLYLRRIVEASNVIDLARYSLNRIQLEVARNYEKWMFNPFRRVVVVSERDREELESLNPHLKIDVIPNGVDLDHFKPQEVEREEARLMFLGNYEYAPNVDAALLLAGDVLPKVRERVPGATLWLVGNAPPPELEELAEDDEGIVITGRVPDVRAYYAKAAVFVCPLRLGAGIKNKLLEALAMGTPVVATRLSMDGIAIHDGHDVLIADEEDMAEAVVRLLENDDLRESLSANGRDLIEEFYSWDRVADAYRALYQEIAAG